MTAARWIFTLWRAADLAWPRAEIRTLAAGLLLAGAAAVPASRRPADRHRPLAGPPKPFDLEAHRGGIGV